MSYITGFRSGPRDIREALTEEAIALAKPLAKFVTVDAYVAAGGVIQRDLFDTENEGFMPDRALALRLAQGKLEAAVDAVKAEGWKWVKAEAERDYSVSYGHVYPNYDDEEEGERTPRYEPEDMERAGAILRVDYAGELAIERGLVLPEDRVMESGPDTPKKEREPGQLPATLIRELSAHRTAALQAAMAHNPAIALAATVATLALPLFYHSRSASCLDIDLRPTKAEDIVAVTDECEAHAVMASEKENWGERLPGNPNELLAYCAARSVNVVTDRVGITSSRSTHAEALARRLALDMATQWKPSVEGFYGRLNKATMVAMVQEAHAPLSIRLAEVKKDTAARHVMEAMAETNWLPSILRGSEKMQSDEEVFEQAA